MTKVTKEEAEALREKRRQELKQILNTTTLPEFKSPSPDFIRELLLDYLETCDNDAARIAKKEPPKGELFMFNFGRQMLLEKFLRELGQGEVISKLKNSRLDYHVAKNMREESKFSKFVYSIKKTFRPKS